MWKARDIELVASSSVNMRKHSPLVRYVAYTTYPLHCCYNIIHYNMHVLTPGEVSVSMLKISHVCIKIYNYKYTHTLKTFNLTYTCI